MHAHFRSIPLILFVVMASSLNWAANQGFTTLDVNGDHVTIYRDEFGVPHIFAETNRGLFVGYGYGVAQDRLWQLELFRRAATGRLAEILGTQYPATNLGSGMPGALAIDLDIRTRFYTEVELQAQYALLDPEEAEIFQAYADGINRYLKEVVVPDSSKLPFEFRLLGIGVPQPWTAIDVVADGVYQSRFGGNGGMERQNQTLLSNLIAHCATVGLAKDCDIAALGMFNDIRWIDDPDTPVSVPPEGAVGKRQHAPPPSTLFPEQLDGALSQLEPSLEDIANAALVALGVPISSGSHAWVIGPAKSVNGSAMLFGSPQVGFNTPELFHEVQIRGGNGFDVTGWAFAGVPVISHGRTDHTAWSQTSGTFGDNRDTYVEQLCTLDTGETGYLFDGVTAGQNPGCTPFETRVELISVKDAAPVTCTVRRSVHGPVVFPQCNVPFPATGSVFTQKRVVWMHDIEFWRAQIAFERAKNLQEFQAAVLQMEAAENVVYADKLGNIAYFFAGKVPVRPVNGYDPRLPLPGTGQAEWSGEFRPMPFSINPTRGWLDSWNSKPALGYPNPDQRSFGKQSRWLEIDQRLQTGLISVDDIKDIEKDISRTTMGGDGRESRYLKPYLLAALDAGTMCSNPPASPLRSQAAAVLERWDGSLFADAVTSTTLEPGQVIFDKWLTHMMLDTFAADWGTAAFNQVTSQFHSNILIHALDHACFVAGNCPNDSGVPPSRDYFEGVNPNCIMVKAFDEALADLPDPAAWSTEPRRVVRLHHTLYPDIPEVGTLLDANRGTYAFVVVFNNPKPTSESILSLGQSGFIGPRSSDFDPHFADQLPIFKTFSYKPMHLFMNTQLKE
jgi:penicillin amidase